MNCTLPPIIWKTDDSLMRTRKFAKCGKLVLEWWPYNQSWHIGTVDGVGPLAESKDKQRRYNGGNAGQRACEKAYWKLLGAIDHPPIIDRKRVK